MKRINDRYLYCLNDFGSGYEDIVPTFIDLFGNCFSVQFGSQRQYWSGGIGSKLWEYVWHEYCDDICIIEDEESDQPNKKEFASKFYAKFKITKEYYEKLIELYEANKNKLMDQVSSTIETINKYNDTPQNGGDFDTDNHTTNSNRSATTSKSDVDTVVSRLNEVRRKLIDVYHQWAKEFDGLFISHLNYDNKGGYLNEY